MEQFLTFSIREGTVIFLTILIFYVLNQYLGSIFNSYIFRIYLYINVCVCMYFSSCFGLL